MTEHAPEGLVSLREYIERILAENGKALDAAFAAQGKAIDAALRNQQEALERARTHIEAIFNEHRKAHDQKHSDDERALEQAREAVNLRLEKLNELRSEVVQDRGEYVRRDVFDTQHSGLADRVNTLENWRSKATGAAIVLTLFAGLVGALIAKALGL